MTGVGAERGGTQWNLGSAWEAIADTVGDAPALIHAEEVRSWSDFEDRSARLASVFTDSGIGPDSKVAHLLYNGPEYIEATFASFKCRSVPVNVNYRYTESELRYLLDNSDAEAVVVSSELAGRLDAVRGDLPGLRLVVQVGDGELIGGAVRYSDAIAAADPAPRIERSADDLWFLYTGGTTGMPKGVMWPHRSLWGINTPSFKGVGEPQPTTMDELVDTVRRVVTEGRTVRQLPAAPLMHGTSAISSWGVLSTGGSIVTLTSHSLDALELLDAVDHRRVTNLVIVGDAFAKPILAALDAEPTRWDLSSLRMVISSGVMWSQPVKDALLAHVDVVLADLVGSSEAVGFANSVAKRGRSAATARFRLGENATVLTDDGVAVEPGSGEVGMLAVGGPIPIGYYKDPDKSAATFRTVGGVTWSIPGDHATVEADGTIRLMGRGSVCINTAGEKVFPEEVEETLKLHPAVLDANVVGVPDDKWGQAVTALVGMVDGAEVADAELVAHCKVTLAGYKCPKHIIVVDRIHRGPNGKADYRWAAAVAADALATVALSDEALSDETAAGT